MPDPISIEKAKNLFYNWSRPKDFNHMMGLLSQRTDSLADSSGYVKYPDWDHATRYIDNVHQLSILEIPIIQDKYHKYYFPDSDSSSTNISSNNKRSLVVVIHPDSRYWLAVCNIIPHPNYISNGGILSNNNYISKTATFDGFEFYTDWSDQIQGAFNFQPGQKLAK